MIETYFFGLGLVNSISLLVVFVMRARSLALLQRVGWAYLLLALPAIYGIVLAQQERASVQYTIFLVIFLGFLVIEALYDWVLKIPFRETMKWPVLLPYVALYIASTYGFVVMPWRSSLTQGIIMLVLFIAQIVANILTHPRTPRNGQDNAHRAGDQVSRKGGEHGG